MFCSVGYTGTGTRVMTSGFVPVRPVAPVANGTVACVLSGVGPTGSQSAIQGWLRVNINGTDRFIPYW